jgi:pimeloyl-ACP methyl ester carboxylesterase
MPIDVQIHGQSGPLVMLLPGGAEAVEGFFPGLEEGLLENPGCRVILYDRPGNGDDPAHPVLADAADDLHRVIAEIGEGPVITVGQSLGGAVSLLLAIRHPEDVAGMVLLDPTPINDVKVCTQLERSMSVIRPAAKIPGVRTLLKKALMRTARKGMEGKDLRPDCREAVDKIGALDLTKLAESVRGIVAIAEDFREDAIPVVPAVVVTADRPADSAIRKAHERIAARLGVPAICWPDADHAVHLDHPDEVLEVTRELVGSAVARGA